MDILVTFPGNKKVDGEMGGFVVHTDQAIAEGGDGTALSPYQHCLVSLATCAGFYVLAYLKNKGLPVEGVSVQQKHEVNPKTGKVEKVGIFIELPPTIEEQHYPAILRSAQQCAVKKLIEHPPAFDIQIGKAGRDSSSGF